MVCFGARVEVAYLYILTGCKHERFITRLGRLGVGDCCRAREKMTRRQATPLRKLKILLDTVYVFPFSCTFILSNYVALPPHVHVYTDIQRQPK